MAHPDESIRNNAAKVVRETVKHSVQVQSYYTLYNYIDYILYYIIVVILTNINYYYTYSLLD